MFGHYYHVWADGEWSNPVAEHEQALADSGLLDALAFVRVGIVGAPGNREAVRSALTFGEVVVEANEGWEQVTLNMLRDWVVEHPVGSRIFYAHTKGAYTNDDWRRQWRRSMTYDTITNWETCVEQLEKVDAVGPFWMEKLRAQQKNKGLFFGGNYWWAKSEYLAGLPSLGMETRFEAEDWIGLNRPKVINLRQGEPAPGRFWKP
jgi:hypothetical protein